MHFLYPAARYTSTRNQLEKIKFQLVVKRIQLSCYYYNNTLFLYGNLKFVSVREIKTSFGPTRKNVHLHKNRYISHMEKMHNSSSFSSSNEKTGFKKTNLVIIEMI